MMNTKSLPFQIAEKIISDIRGAKLTPGAKLPPLRNLAKDYEISYVTAQRALKILQDKNYVESKSGGGTYIAEKILVHTPKEKLHLNANSSNEKKIGILLPTWAATSGGASVYETIESFTEICTNNNWIVELINSTPNDINSISLVKKIYQKNFDGLVWLTPLTMHKWILDELAHRVSCLVVSERPFENIGINSIHIDYDSLAKKMLELFVKRKHRKITIFSGQYEEVWADPHSTVIIEAIRKAAESAGIDFDEKCYCQTFPLPQREAGMIIHQFFQEHNDRNAIVCLHNEYLKLIIKEISHLHTNLKDDFTIIDTCYQSNPFYIDNVNNVEIFRIRRPNRNVGIAIGNIFERNWLNKDLSQKINLKAEIVAPGEMI